MILKKKTTLLIIWIFFSLCTLQAQKKQGRSEPKNIKPPEGLVYNVLQYREGNYPRAGQMAVSYKDDAKTNKPVVVFIHGGGWKNGDKDNLAHQIFNVAQKGFVGVSISYRLISEAPFPACIEDVKEAIRFLKSKKDSLPIDVDRIGVWGYSAGAHLALMIALSPNDVFKTAAYADYNSNIKTVMAVSAPTDFVSRVKENKTLTQFSKSQYKSINFQKKVSPLTYINKNQIPIMMLHGTEDPLVKPYHYKNFEKACEKSRIDNFKLYEFEGGGHMFYFKKNKEVKPIFNQFLEFI